MGATAIFPRGTTFHGPSGFGSNIESDDLMDIQLEGTVVEFDDVHPTTNAFRSGQRVKGIIVRNSSGIELVPGSLVTWASGYENRRVDGYANVSYKRAAGFVDDWLSFNVRANDLFVLIIDGPCRMKMPYAEVIAAECSAGSLLYAGTMDASTGNATDDRAGHCQVWDGTFNLTNTTTSPNSTKVLEVARNVVAVAVSAATSGNTDDLKDIIARCRA
jgi:hypothetical protein